MKLNQLILFALLIAGVYIGYHLWMGPSQPKKSHLLTQCLQKPECVEIPKGESIMIGVIQDLSGSAKNFGIDQKRSLEIAIARRGGEVLGHPITLIIEDEACTPEGGRVAAEKMTSLGNIVGVMGTTCSRSASAAGEILSKFGIVLVSGINSAPTLTAIAGKKGKNWQSGYFRTIYSIAEKGRGAAMFAYNELGKTRAAIIHDGDIYTRGYTDLFKDEFVRHGGQINFEGRVNKDETNMLPVLKAAADHAPEILFMPLFEPEMKHVMQQIGEVKALQDSTIIAINTVITDSFLAQVGEKGIGMLFLDSSPPSQNTAIKKYIKEYKERYGTAPLSPSFDYGLDAANLLLDSIEKVSQKLEDGTVLINRSNLKEALYQTRSYNGVTGTLNCDQFGDCGVLRFNIVRLDDPIAGVEGLKNNIIYEHRLDQAKY